LLRLYHRIIHIPFLAHPKISHFLDKKRAINPIGFGNIYRSATDIAIKKIKDFKMFLYGLGCWTAEGSAQLAGSNLAKNYKTASAQLTLCIISPIIRTVIQTGTAFRRPSRRARRLFISSFHLFSPKGGAKIVVYHLPFNF
jgi:hypothetical protein